MFLLDERIFGRFGKLSVMGCLVPQVVIPIHGRPRSLSSWRLWSAVYPALALGAIADEQLNGDCSKPMGTNA
jgi:hypothetical protein